MTSAVATATPPKALAQLHRRFLGLQLRFATLQGQASEVQAQQTRLVKSISLAKARLELEPQVREAFDYLQERAHQRAVGDFEDLLSAFVEDVIPDAGRVRMKLGTHLGLPSLDILLDNGGDLENIYSGNGGGLTNVVVTGLGYSALSRTSNRQFMLLDEPDCWLQAQNVPAFTKVIAEVANPRVEPDGALVPGCQTLMVSHNDISLMDDGAHIQSLKLQMSLEDYAARMGVDVVEVLSPEVPKPTACAHVVWVDGGLRGKSTIEVRYLTEAGRDDESNALTKGYPFVESLGGARGWVDDAQPGIRWIEVINLQRHVNTRIYLSSGLNVLTGGVNGGKSTLVFMASRAMGYGEFDDSMMRHGADTAIVRMGLENNVMLELVRKRKGSPKLEYRKYVDGKLTNTQSFDKGMPDFVTKALNIQRVDKMDIQLRHQKEPVFLLNEPPAKRAKLLSVGRESGLLLEIIERQRKQVKSDRDLVKREEVELNFVNRQLLVMAPLAHMAGLVDICQGLHEEAEQLGATAAHGRALLAQLAPLEGKAKLSAQFEADKVCMPAMPALHEVQALASLVAKMEATQFASLLPDMPLAPVAPVLHDTTSLTALVTRIDRCRPAAQLPDLPELPKTPILSGVEALTALLDRMKAGQHAELLATTLPAVPSAPVLNDTVGLRALGVKLSSAATAVADAETEAVGATAEQTAADCELHKYQHELGVCPLCDTPFQKANDEL